MSVRKGSPASCAAVIRRLFGRARVAGVAVEVTDRGFKHYAPIATTYGHVLRVYESSAAAAPHLWLDVDMTAAQTESPTAHMTLEQAATLRDALTVAIENHYQEVGDAG